MYYDKYKIVIFLFILIIITILLLINLSKKKIYITSTISSILKESSPPILKNVKSVTPSNGLPVNLPPNPMDLFPPSIGPNIVVYIPDITVNKGDTVYLPVYAHGINKLYDYALILSIFKLSQYYTIDIQLKTYILDGDILGDASLYEANHIEEESYSFFSYLMDCSKNQNTRDCPPNTIEINNYTIMKAYDTPYTQLNKNSDPVLFFYIRLSNIDTSKTNRLQEFPILIYTKTSFQYFRIDVRNLPIEMLNGNISLSCYRNGVISDSCCFDKDNVLIDCITKKKVESSCTCDTPTCPCSLTVPLLPYSSPTSTSIITSTSNIITNNTLQSNTMKYIYISIGISVLIVIIWLFIHFTTKDSSSEHKVLKIIF